MLLSWHWKEMFATKMSSATSVTVNPLRKSSLMGGIAF